MSAESWSAYAQCFCSHTPRSSASKTRRTSPTTATLPVCINTLQASSPSGSTPCCSPRSASASPRTATAAPLRPPSGLTAANASSGRTEARPASQRTVSACRTKSRFAGTPSSRRMETPLLSRPRPHKGEPPCPITSPSRSTTTSATSAAG